MKFQSSDTKGIKMKSYDDYFKAVKKNKSSANPEKVLKQGQSSRRGHEISDEKKIEAMLRKKLKARKSRKKPTPINAVTVSLALGLVLAVYGVIFPEQVDGYLSKVSKISIGFFSQGSAEEPKASEKKSTPKDLSQAKTAEEKISHEKAKEGIENSWTEENISNFSKLNQRKKELDQREKELSELEQELHNQRSEIEARIKKLEQIRSQIADVLKERVGSDQEKVKKLVEFYSNMKPQRAAQILATVNEDLAVEILGKMKKKNAADILNLLPPAKAQIFTEKYAGYREARK